MTVVRIAWLYPSTGLLDDYLHQLARSRGAELLIYRVEADPDADLDVASLGEPDRLGAAAETAASSRPDVVVWGCTAGSFILGGDAEKRQRQVLSGVAGCAATTTTAALKWALRRAHARSVVALTPYTEAVGREFTAHLDASGFSIVAQVHAGHATDPEISAMMTSDILALIPKGALLADAIVLPCTGLRSEHAAPFVEAATGCPVVTANAATLDHAVLLAAKARLEREGQMEAPWQIDPSR